MTGRMAARDRATLVRSIRSAWVSRYSGSSRVGRASTANPIHSRRPARGPDSVAVFVFKGGPFCA